MLFEDRTLENILSDLKGTVGSGISTDEGTLIDHAFRGAAAELEKAYIELSLVDQNGYAETADREHLILRAKERGIEPFAASNAIWKASLNAGAGLGVRFSAGELTYICTEVMGDGKCRLMCEQAGARGNIRQEGLAPIEYTEGFESGELEELLVPARDEEGTEDFRARYTSIVAAAQAFGGNRAQYKAMMHGIEGVGACKLYRVTQGDRRIKIYFLDSTYRTPSSELVRDVQETVDPSGKQGEGEGEAAMFHVVDICPCASKTVNIEAEITAGSGQAWEDLLPKAQEKVDGYFLELAKGWEDGGQIVVRVLRVNAAIASIDGIVDVQGTMLNGKSGNLTLDPNEVPVRGEITCRN